MAAARLLIGPRLGFGMLALLALLAGGPGVRADEDTPLRVATTPYRGTVVDGKTGQPIPSVAVVILWQRFDDQIQGLRRLVAAREVFTNELGGNAMMYVNLIWIWGHPEVYILILPAFGIFSGSHEAFRLPFLILVSVVAVAFILVMLKRLRNDALGIAAALAFILGGAIGNLIDRVVYGEVIDFLDVYWSNYHWPAFNVADSFITLGVTITLLYLVKAKGEDPFAAN